MLHHYHGGSVPQKRALTAWNDPSKESFNTLLLIYVLGTFERCMTELLLTSLGLILEDFERPNKPVGYHGSCAGAKELPYFIVEDRGMTSHGV